MGGSSSPVLLLPHDDEYCGIKDMEETPNIFNMLLQLPLLNCDDLINSSPISVASFPDHPPPPFLMNDSASSDTMHMEDHDMVVPQMSEIESGLLHFSVSSDYSQLVPEPCNFIWQLPPAPTYNINIPMPAQNSWVKMEETTGIPQKVCRRYSVEERKARIVRYLKKRSRRNFNKKIKYACRKTLADKRVRVRGRFVKKSNEPSPDPNPNPNSNSNSNDHHVDYKMMRCEAEEDDWLQAALGDIEHLPYLDMT